MRHDANVLCLALAVALTPAARACTAIAVSKGASAHGSAMITHSDDSGGAADLRMARVRARDHKVGALRPVYLSISSFPRLIAPERSRDYSRENLPAGLVLDERWYEPLGYIPQVPHTYGYHDLDYGAGNEVGLVMGESTCAARLAAQPRGVTNGTALFGIEELSRVALERCATARCAVTTMGELAETFGYYGGTATYGAVYADGAPNQAGGAGPSVGTRVSWPGLNHAEAAEALVIADRTGEAWVFHVLADDTGASAIWAAKKVPEGEVAIVANNFVIRTCDEGPDSCLLSSNAEAVARRAGLLGSPATGKAALGQAGEGHGAPTGRAGGLDFTATFGYEPEDRVQLQINRYYTGRRIWRVFDILAPSLKLDPGAGHVPTRPAYPFSVKPEQPVTAQQLVSIHRDHYEGTPFDLTRGVAAGPFGSPNRYAGAAETSLVKGAWERAISMHRSLWAYVAVAGRDGPPPEAVVSGEDSGDGELADDDEAAAAADAGNAGRKGGGGVADAARAAAPAPENAGDGGGRNPVVEKDADKATELPNQASEHAGVYRELAVSVPDAAVADLRPEARRAPLGPAPPGAAGPAPAAFKSSVDPAPAPSSLGLNAAAVEPGAWTLADVPAGRETVIWFGADSPHASFFSPLFPAIGFVPAELRSSNEATYDPEGSAWWACNSVKYLMDLNFRNMRPIVERAQTAWETKAFDLALDLETAIARTRGEGVSPDEGAATLGTVTSRLADHWGAGTQSWRRLFGELMVALRNGYNNTALAPGVVEEVGFDRFPQPAALSPAPSQNADPSAVVAAAATAASGAITPTLLGHVGEVPGRADTAGGRRRDWSGLVMMCIGAVAGAVFGAVAASRRPVRLAAWRLRLGAEPDGEGQSREPLVPIGRSGLDSYQGP